MIDATSKALFHTLAQSDLLRRLASRYGMRRRGFARRFIAGETIDEALSAVAGLPSRGLRLTLDYLGESVSTPQEARAFTDTYLQLVQTIVASGVERNLSVKLTQLGLDVSDDLAFDHMRRLLDATEPQGFFVRVDMENSPYVDRTLDAIERLWGAGYRQVGTVIQSCLFRAPADVARLCALGVRVRLVKGAYKEPAAVAHQSKADVDAAYLVLMRQLLDTGHFPAFATHDMQMINTVRAYANERGIDHTRFEFQMLYGIRRDLQTSLVSEGYGMRVYVPFGQQWFPYFMRRLGERPANVGFVLRGVLGEG